MNRRRFLSLLAVGAPAAVVAERLGLYDRIRSYFFAPIGGWSKRGDLWTTSQSIALQLEKVSQQIPVLFENDLLLHHSFENGGASSGVCRMCNGPITIHSTVHVSAGQHILVARNPFLPANYRERLMLLNRLGFPTLS
jgi:hypothetical protein